MFNLYAGQAIDITYSKNWNMNYLTDEGGNSNSNSNLEYSGLNNLISINHLEPDIDEIHN